jgi:hypothetical protein
MVLVLSARNLYATISPAPRGRAGLNRRPWDRSIPILARSSHRGQHNADADPAAYKKEKSTKVPRGASVHQLLPPSVLLPLFTLPFTIGGYLPGLFILVAEGRRVQNCSTTLCRASGLP